MCVSVRRRDIKRGRKRVSKRQRGAKEGIERETEKRGERDTGATNFSLDTQSCQNGASKSGIEPQSNFLLRSLK